MSSTAACNKTQPILQVTFNNRRLKACHLFYFCKNNIHSWLITSEHLGRHTTGKMTRKEVFVLILKVFIFIQGKTFECAFYLRAISLVKIFFKYIWNGIAKQCSSCFSGPQRLVLWTGWSKLVDQSWHYIQNEHNMRLSTAATRGTTAIQFCLRW